ncbi:MULTISPECIES: alkaline phosphatase family protein [Haloferax]|uniref:Nucleotide pyrophosphatase n=1 Tax=Haloferax marinum TaxID=2666143 RepID=A0A6A8G9P7_9EURY|nr:MULTISPECIES: alkaline phosphatase family protein [Haloferax]KAB1198215.1 nucleotide pyrophosphatase [Haloferax sp. CBA1150]MRW97302.1 nucleotide pyrophosphatase [Haloferax marinum]
MDTLVIGLDGGEWDVINPLIQEGKLPNIAQLKQEGVSGPLESITPPVSPPAWTSIQTGTNPGKHGIFDFSTFDENYNRRSINSSDRSATPFWEIMNNEGTTTGLFKVPFTYPPEDVDGFMVTGFPTPNTVKDFATPESLLEDVGPVEDLFEDWSLQQAGDYEAFKQNLIEVAERQTEIFLELIRKNETDFSMTVYDGSDRIQHFFWKYFDETHPRYDPESPLSGAIEEYYQTVDQGIGELLEETGDNCDVVVISDHGFGPLSHDIYIDEWLEREGLLVRKSPGSKNNIAKSALSTIVVEGWHVMNQVGLDSIIKSVLPESWFLFGSNLRHEPHRNMVWRDTTAFFTTLSGQALYINLKNRFSKGKVSPEQYDEIVEEVCESICSIKHPETGEKLVESVIRSDEEFEGWKLDDAPDLIVRTVPNCTLKGGYSESLLQSSAQNKHDRSGDHRSEGILIASGPSFRSGTFDGANVLDIAPTLLHLQDCPIPNVIDGSVMKSALSSRILNQKDIKKSDQYGRSNRGGRQWSDDEEAEIEKRLSDMGYLG